MAEQLTSGLIITDPAAQLARKDRRCLSCSGMFASNAPGNRICRGCKSTEVFQSSPNSFSVHASF
jgi:hypothetical protein